MLQKINHTLGLSMQYILAIIFLRGLVNWSSVQGITWYVKQPNLHKSLKVKYYIMSAHEIRLINLTTDKLRSL